MGGRQLLHDFGTRSVDPRFARLVDCPSQRCFSVLDMTSAECATWVQAGSTVALLVVTGFYAWKTKDMADSAKKSAVESARASTAAEETVRESGRAAQAAERSAEASRDAARVAQSQIRPEFSARRVGAKNVSRDDHTGCLRIESTGDAVVVLGVRILRAFRRSTMRDGVDHIDVENEPLEPWGIDTVLPKRLHLGENILVTHPALQDARADPLDYFILQVDYAFDEHGTSGGTRQIKVDETPKP